MSAVVTTKASSIPVMSTSTCRFRPTIFFSRVVPADSRVVRRLDGLAVHRRRTRFGGLALDFQPDILADPGMKPIPDAGQLPTTHLRVHRLPLGEVVRQHPPRTA